MRLPALFLACFAPILAQAAQAGPQSDPQSDNVGHERHKHKHGEPVPTSDDASRFHTSRKGALLPLPGEEDAFFFVVYGDRTGGPARGVSVLANAVRDTNLLHPDFVFTVGDLIQGYNDQEPWLKQMREYKSVMDELLCPWFPVAGNHDVYWRGPDKPEGEHESNYEMHFGPLWYAFEHKNSWFISLYTDEGNPLTGERTFSKPEAQRMSPEQFEWLQSILKRAKDAEHIFIFAHHPRWIGGRYGDDWNRVHKALVQAGNVSAVFGGHVHYMRSDPQDDIEYITLATTGGNQDGHVPQVGWLHHFNIVTVRKGQIALSALPVGEVMDVREITYDVVQEAKTLAKQPPTFDDAITVLEKGSSDQRLSLRFRNPTTRPILANFFLESEDSRWRFAPDHTHKTLQPGETLKWAFDVKHQSLALDDTFQPPKVSIQLEYLMPGYAYSIPRKSVDLPLQVQLTAPAIPATDVGIDLSNKSRHLSIANDRLILPDGPFTLETWIEAKYLSDCGIIAKTERSEFGLFLSDQTVKFYLHLDGAYTTLQNKDFKLKPNQRTHVAAVFDGKQIRLYIDGQLVKSKSATGRRGRNALPLIVGGDVNDAGRMHQPFRGVVYGMHIASSALYTGDSFVPPERFTSKASTRLLLNMDSIKSRWLFDEAREAHHVFVPRTTVLTSQR